MSRKLSGHPEALVITAPAVVPEPWGGAFAPTLTAWSGPWGVSFTANFTPDEETGVLRDFTEDQFIQTMRTGRHQGQGRAILPPMPWPMIGKLGRAHAGAPLSAPRAGELLHLDVKKLARFERI